MNKILTLFFLFLTVTAFSQKKITGTVTSAEDKEPLIGAAILIKGTANGTVTDLDGKYELEVSEGAVIVVSFVGLVKQEITIGASNEYNIILKSEAVSLQEVVVVAYGTQRKDRFNGSVSTVKSDNIATVPAASVDKMLQGNVPGLMANSSSGQPGASSEIRIRGTGSMYASNEPLYVIDGVPVISGKLGENTTTSNALAMINPADIESITVQKDAAAASLYGSRAANGVIMITTKQGKKGKTQFGFRTSQGWSERATKNYTPLNSTQYMELNKAAMQNSGFPQWQIDQLKGSDAVNTNWADAIFRKGYFSTYDLSASGGDDKTTFFTSGSYLSQNGIVIGSDLQRGTGKLNLVHKATDKFTIGLNTNLSYAIQNTPSGGDRLSNPILAALLLPPNIPIQSADGSYNYNFTALNGYNPVGLAQLDIREMRTNRNLSNAYLDYKLTPDLSFRTNWSLDMIEAREKVFLNPDHGDGKSTNGLGQRVFNRKSSWMSSNILKYSKKFKELHSVEAMAGYEAQSFNTEYSMLGGTNFPNSRLTEVDAASLTIKPSSYGKPSSLLSYLTNVQYNFNERYYIGASSRVDGCSRFGSERRYGFFYSISGSWRVNDEAFLKDVSQINTMKLKASYGTSGNSDINEFASRNLYYTNSYYGNPGIYPGQYGNSYLTWEKKKALNIGLDLKIFNRFTFNIDFYNSITDHLIFQKPLPATTGYINYTSNVAEMRNRGLEFSLTTENLKDGSITWFTTFNVTINRNKILALDENKDIIDGISIKRVGEDINSYYTREWAGVNPADGSPMWYDANGNIVYNYVLADRTIVGSSAPKFFGGINNSFSWKNFDLSFLFFINYGNKIYDSWSTFTDSDGKLLNYNQNSEQMNYWKNPGDIVSVPKPYVGNPMAGVASTRFIHDGSYIRLKNLAFSYTLPKTFVQKAKLNMVKVYVSGQNILTFSRYKGHEVERGTDGFNNANFPITKTITFGIDVGF